ncbi:MAG: radical SAM protein [Chloroflexota bacterium]
MAGYQHLFETGELQKRAHQAWSLLGSCRLCPRQCKVNRLAGEVGKCRTGREAVVSSCGPHFGEESPLVGQSGSGTIFFTHCNLRCTFCQNYTISQLGEGEGVYREQLASMMLSLQRRGCHNVNLVTPSHVVPQILVALEIAVAKGLSIPLVYNSGGYDSVETLKLLDGVVDIYMPDMKYSDEGVGQRLSAAKNYPAINLAAIREMHRQVGNLEMDARGIATRGLLVRHLVLPHGLAGTGGVVSFLAEEISKDTYLNVMAQYRPAYRACEVPALSRPLSEHEYSEAVRLACQHGLKRLDSRQARLSPLHL